MTPEVWLFCSEGDMARTKALRAMLRTELRKRDWQFQERKSKVVRTPGGGNMSVAEARDVVAAYTQAHRTHVAILTYGPIRLCTEPPEERAIRRDLTLTVPRYCQYKAFCRVLPANCNEVEQSIAGFSEWMNSVHCLGDPDPRCLPFPTFKADQGGFDNLNDPEGRSKFEVAHRNGKRGGRASVCGLVWEADPRAFHGHETLQVGGTPLSRGFHWDVQNSRRSPTRLGSPLEIWEVKSYANVFPDGKIAGRHPYAARIVHAGK